MVLEVAVPRPNRTLVVALMPLLFALTQCPHPEHPDVDCYGVPDDSAFCFTLHSLPQVESPGIAVGGRIGPGPRESMVVVTIAAREVQSVTWKDGEFAVSAPVPFYVNAEQILRLVDFAGDPLPDLFVSHVLEPTFVMTNTGETFAPFQVLELDVYEGRMIPIDVDADGVSEMLVGNRELASLWKREDGVWSPRGSEIAVPSCYTLYDGHVADFNEDGYEDIAFIGSPGKYDESTNCSEPPGQRGIKVLLSNPNTHLLDEAAFIPLDMSLIYLVGGDFDGDGITDLAGSDQSIVVLKGHGDGNFGPPQIVSDGYEIVDGDFDGDGSEELAVTRYPENSGEGELWLMDDVLTEATFTRLGPSHIYPLGSADLNEDGIDDLALLTGETKPSSLEILLSAE